MKRKRNWNIGGVDRISELPEGIIHGIMSHLSSKEVAQTCVLSKKWYHVKKNYPVLKFEVPLVRAEERFDYLIKLRPAVYDSLNHFSTNKLALQTFSLKNVILGFIKRKNVIWGQHNFSSDLDHWIKVALDNGVKELTLCARKLSDIYAMPGPDSYALPLQVFSSKTLTTLDLTFCVLDVPISIFSSLKKLALTECSLKGSISLKDTDCPVLEEMTVRRCRGEGFKSIYIPSLLRLHTVVVNDRTDWDDEHEFITVEILSQSIHSLALISKYGRPWSDFNIYGCDRLKSLYLSCPKITDAELQSLLLNFPQLEELYLFDCQSLRMIKISSPLLRTLEICSELNEGSLKHIEVSAPNLEIFIYKSFEYEPFGKSVIEVADCCQSLKTLVLCGHLMADEVFHNLILKFPLLLQNIWVIGCNILQNIKVPNLQLKGLYIVGCSGVKVVEVSSPNLREFYCSSRTLPKSSVADAVCARGVRCKRSSIDCCLLRLKEMLKSVVLVKVECILNQVVNVGDKPFNRSSWTSTL